MGTIQKRLISGKHMLFDGAMGTQLQLRGLEPGQSPEEFCLKNLNVLESIHAAYAEAGADVITTNTFGGTAFKLPEGLSVYEFNKEMACAARRVAARHKGVFVAGSIGPTGQLLKPLGDKDFADLVEAFIPQIQGLVEGGVDLLIAETHYDVAEARAIVVAARRVCSLPIAVSMTYESGRTLTGSTADVCLATFANMGVDLIGLNCSGGPAEMQETVNFLLHHSPVPIIVQPNAGLPKLDEQGTTIFPLGTADFARLVGAFAGNGVQCVGGCCGTSPEHIAALRQKLDGLGAVGKRPARSGVWVTSRSCVTHIGGKSPFCAIGERINPTGKKKLTASLQAGELDLALQYAEEQVAAGARVLDVNVGAPHIDEVALLPALVAAVAASVATPLCIDSSNNDAVAAALAVYPASPLVNSISGEEGRMETLGPLCRDYGAPFILLPLQGNDLPMTAAERITILDELLTQMDELRVPRYLAMVDVLVLTLSSSPNAALECLEVIDYCHKQGLPVVCGLSNISFGLPARDMINAYFLTMAAGAGLDAAIVNPSAPRLAEALKTIDILRGHDEGAETFIAHYSNWQHGTHVVRAGVEAGGGVADGSTVPLEQALHEAVVRGQKNRTVELVQQLLSQKADPFALVNEWLIPAIERVGELYEQKVYFLPQLIRAAEAMQAAFTQVQPLMAQQGMAAEKTVIVLATVEGDIHDIGKNIVKLLLINHGFEVVDLGKNVKAADIVSAVRKHKAHLVGLSALMTTTIVRMEDTIKLLREEQLDVPVLVGGAVVTDLFAKAIGAHYSKDAVDAVRVAKSLLV